MKIRSPAFGTTSTGITNIFVHIFRSLRSQKKTLRLNETALRRTLFVRPLRAIFLIPWHARCDSAPFRPPSLSLVGLASSGEQTAQKSSLRLEEQPIDL